MPNLSPNRPDPTQTPKPASRTKPRASAPPQGEDAVADFVLRGRIVAYHGNFAKVVGGAMPALLLSQLYYWSRHTSAERDGWFWKTQNEIQDETGLTRREQETARRILRDHCVLEEEKRGLPAKLYFRVNIEELFNVVRAHLERGAPSSGGTASSGGTPAVHHASRSAARTHRPTGDGPPSHAVPPGPPAADGSRVQTSPAESDIPARTECTDYDGGDVHTRMAESAILDRLQPPSLKGDSAQPLLIEKTSTEDHTRRRTTTGSAPPDHAQDEPSGGVVVASSPAAPVPEDQTDVVRLLCERGVTRRNALSIAERHPADTIRRQLAMIDYRKADEPAAVLVSAIEQDWAPPQAYVKADQERRDAEHVAAARRQSAAEREREDRDEEARRARIEQLWGRLVDTQRQALEEQARALFRQRNPSLARALEKNPDGPIVRSMLRHIREELVEGMYGGLPGR